MTRFRRRHGRLITIGSFDGVHLGHGALISRTVLEARRRRLAPLALTFRIPPRIVLGGHAFPLLTHSREKAFLIGRMGVDEVEVWEFDDRVAQTTPFAFFREVLIRRYNAKGLVVGADFRFGAGRSAGARELVKWGLEFEIPVWVIPPVMAGRTAVSSTRIRRLLALNRFTHARTLLGHPYTVIGDVVPGRAVGRTLGFPTVNLTPPAGKILPRGVFVVTGQILHAAGRRMKDARPVTFRGVCNIGVRPTFAGQSTVSVEVHVLSGRLPRRGRPVLLELHTRLRAEKRFRSPAALARAIATDVAAARAHFSRYRLRGS